MFDIAIRPKNRDGEIVVLIHGLFHCSAVMYPLGRFLNNHGYVVFCYDYRSTRGDVAKHATRFKLYLENLARTYPDKRINIVTHSLGSLVTRQALAHFAEGATDPGEILTRQTIGRVVFTAPPNRGSKVATLALKWLPFISGILRPLADLSYGEFSSVHEIPIPTDIELGIIAAKYDHMVPRDSVQLPSAQTDYKMMPAIHVIVMNTPSVQREILHFLQHGKFSTSIVE
ncbi:MAG: alpha/beta fold hydrolase [Victivallaceae bacterium]|nr:alpha/beta fold hydrolase [Victivallaceae bacterium]